MTMIPIKIQNVQLGALSADRAFQSQKHQPELAHRVFEAAVQREIDESHKRPEAMEKGEKALIREKQEQKKESGQRQEAKKRQARASHSEKSFRNQIEKEENGNIKHLDVKI